MDFSLITYHLILPMLEFFKKLFGNYGWAIIAVTIFVKLVLYPLTKHQTESMKKMQAIQPKIKIIQERFNQQKDRYKDRPAKLKEIQADFQKDMMEFYQSNKVNPLGGCLPMLFQLPILIALFWAFNGSPFKPVAITVPIEVLSEDKAIYEQRKGASNPAIYVGEKGEKGRILLSPGDVKITPNKDITYMVLKLEGNLDGVTNNAKWELSDRPYYTPTATKKPDLDSIVNLVINSNNSATIQSKKPGRVYLNAILSSSHEKDRFLFISELGKSSAFDPITGKINLDIIILVLLFVITIWLSSKVTSGYSPPPADPKQAEMQKMMQKMMPPMVGMMMLFFPVPAGVLLYFVASGFIQAFQTWWIMRKPLH